MKKQKRKTYFRILTKLMRMKYKRPNFIYLGEPVTEGAIILSNHEGTDAPMALEMYHPEAIRMWGAHEMNSGLRAMYKYQTKVYYHEKKHWNLFLARLFCLLASPLTNLFYSGFDLISTYKDARLIKTIRESTKALKEGYNIAIFPEDSSKGYLEELEGFFGGFTLLCKECERKDIKVPVYVAYYRKSDKTYIFSEPMYYKDLADKGMTDSQIAGYLCNRCNQLRFVKKEDVQVAIDTQAKESVREVSETEEKDICVG